MIEITYTRKGRHFAFEIRTAITRVTSTGYHDIDKCQEAAREIAYFGAEGKTAIKEINLTDENIKR